MDTIPMRVLLVDENADAWHALFSEITDPRFQFRSATSLAGAREMLASLQFDAAICSQHQSEFLGALPWILFVDEEPGGAQTAARVGAFDFLSRNQLSAPLVERCVRFVIERKKCETARLKEQQFAQSTYDALLYPFAVLDERGDVVALNSDVKRTYLVTKGPLRVTNNEIVGVMGVSRDITQRKQFEQTLHETTREIVTIWESMTDAFYSVDPQWRFTHVNSQAAQLFGRSAAELLGKNLWEEFPVAVGLKFYTEYHRAVDEGVAVNFEEFYAPENAWNEIHAYPSPLGLSVYFRDISERKRVEEQLHFQKSLLETPTESFLDGILVVSGDDRILSCNQRFLQMWDIPAPLVDEGDDAPLLQAVTERVANPDAFLERVKALYRHRDERSHEELLLRDGRIFDRYSAPLTTTGGSYEGRVWYFRDITTQRHAENALRESEERSSAVIRGALDCIITIDQNDCIVEFNPAAETTFGWTRTEALGQILSQLILPPEFRGAHSQGIAKYLATGEGPFLNRRVEVPALRKDGTQISVELSVTVITHASLPLFTAHLRDITASKKAQDALRASEQRFQSIVANVPGMVYQFALHPDGSTEWPFVGEGCREIYELEPEAIKSDPTRPIEMIHPDDLAEFQSSVLLSAQTLLPWQWEGRIRPRSGKTRWIRGASRPQRLTNGVVLWDGLLMDITARHDAESERDRFFTMSLEMLGIAGFDGYFKRLNPAFSQTMGYSEAEFMAKPFVDFVHPDDRAATQEATLKLSQGDPLVGFENRYLTKDGAWRWLEWKAVGIVEEGVVYAAARDVTAQKEAKIALEQSEMRLRALVESIDEIVFESDSEGIIVNVWTSDETLLTFPKHEIIGRHAADVLGEDVARSFVDVFQRVIATGKAENLEYTLEVMKESRCFLARISPILSSDGTCRTVCMLARDITARKQNEAALLQMRDELEIRVEERTAELEHSNATLQGEIVERERAEREVRAQARQHEAVAELGRRALLNFDLDTLFNGAVSLVAATLDVEICSFWERLPGSDTLRLRAGVGLSPAMKNAPDKQLESDSQIRYTARLGEVVISEDLSRETRFRPTSALVEQGINSKITIPVYDDVLYGVLAACSPHKEKFSANEINFLQTVANVLSSACARRESEAKILQLNLNLQSANDELRANETRLLQGNQISTDLMRLRVRTRDELQNALHQITESASAMLGVERSSVWLFDEDGTRLRCLDLFQRSTQQHSSGLELFEDENYFPIIKSQRVLVADDARTHPATCAYTESYLKPNGIVSMLDIALVVGGKHIGVLCSEHVGEMRQWQAEDRTFASAIASVCSLVLESYERARAELALQEAKEEAEHATESANAANLAKSEFLSRMSHELRTPLNAILGFGQILEMRVEAPKQLANIQQILKAGRHLLGLINEVLDIARIEAGGLSLSLEPINIGIVVQESLDLVRPLAVVKEIELINNVTGQLAEKHLLADQQRFKQVLLNLLSNAVKYGGDGGQVFVECEFGSTSQRPYLRVSVRDTGAGLSAEDISRLFVPFERLGAARTQIEGTGIGLTLCKHLVEAMNGSIGVASQPGRGSTFWVEMPLVESPVERAVHRDARQTTSLPDVLETVLYIEDNLSNINLIEQVLADGNYHVRLLTAMQGSVGLELAIQHLPDLILLDVHLPDIMGDVVLRHLKDNAATRDIPVVVLSADATHSQVERLLSGGAKAYLTKPLDLKQFFSVLESVLEQTS